MIKTKMISLLCYNRFSFGDQFVSQFVIFECKWLFSIIVFYFHKSKGHQDRFHTHAFNAISFKIFGTYDEHKLTNAETGDYTIKKRTEFFRYFPMDSFHRIANSNGCCTVLMSGRWRKNWVEYVGGEIVKYERGRILSNE